MKLLFKSMKRQLVPTVLVGAVYTLAFLILIVIMKANSRIYFKIDPYNYASDVVDFFLGLIVSIPFSYHTFFMKKNGFLEYVSMRTTKKRYIITCFAAALIMCFLMVFVANIIAVAFSCSIATIDTSEYPQTLSGYVLGNMQMTAPMLFGIIWSLHKAFIGTLICLFAQIIALYVDNMFLALFTPYVYIMLENFFTAILQIPQYSLTTTFVLNRLTPTAMSVFNIAIGVLVFMVVIVITYIVLRRRYEKNK